MKKTVIISIILIILVVCFAATIISCTNTVNADAYSSKIIEFNQYYKNGSSDNTTQISVVNSNILKINETTTNTIHISLTKFTFILGHKYYIGTTENFVNWNAFVHNGQGIKYFKESQIFIPTATNDISYLYIYANETPKQFAINVIDLTQCFGSGKEPETVDEVKTIFPGEYYLYTSGSLMMYYPNATAESVAQTQTLNFEINSGNLYKNDSYQTRVTMDTNTGYTQIFTNIGNVEGYQPEAGAKFDFKFNIPAGSKVTIEIKNLSRNGLYSDIMLYGPGTDYYTNFIDSITDGHSSGEVYDYYKQIYTQKSYNTLELSLVGSGNINQYALQWQKFKITVEYVSNMSEVLDQAYNNGKSDMQEYYTKDNPGYTRIFNEGVASVNTGDQIFPDTWDFIGSAFTAVGDMLSIELFPNIPLGLFVALPLLLGLIAFIVKITKGGN